MLIHQNFAKHIARQFVRTMSMRDDLQQVAITGLILAVDRYDVERGTPFLAFAAPTIRGEIQRYLRDQTSPVYVPRRLQQLATEVVRAKETLDQQLFRHPSTRDIAHYLRVREDEVLAAEQAAAVRQTISREQLASGIQDAPVVPVIDTVGANDPNLSTVEQRHLICAALSQLPARERTIIGLRFVYQLSQADIAARLGVSQMHVSRLLRKSLHTLGLRCRAPVAPNALPVEHVLSG